MSDFLLPLILLLLALAIFTQDDFTITLVYLFAGVYALGSWWSRKALEAVKYTREYPSRVFPGEDFTVKLEFTNPGWLPVVWMQINESIPVDLAQGNLFRQVAHIAPRGKATFEYQLFPRKRGYYTVGPLRVQSGDVLGLVDDLSREGTSGDLIVYPRVISLTDVRLPSRSPLGTLRHTQPIFEDPTRVIGKREYIAGDSLRRVDWKATAATRRLQVKIFEPSIALETAIFLNLNFADYLTRYQYDATELGITVAASLATWLAGKKQSVGLLTNGLDPISGGVAKPIPPRAGRGQITRILETLARVKAGEGLAFIDLIQESRVSLPWGTTLIFITASADEKFFDEVFRASRAGLSAVLILCGPVADLQQTRARAEYFGIPLVHFQNEQDLDVWR
ncbi:MAG: DUF58 domain-containing protein [Anaerolineales bacterium]|nr:DUF58 domain-containing protein [Anaerolineales bacterium]